MKRSARRFCFWVWRARRASSRSERSPAALPAAAEKQSCFSSRTTRATTHSAAQDPIAGRKAPYLCVPFTKDELGDALGCNACALCAILDAPFAKAFLEDLPELAQQHEEILQELTRQTARVQKRRQEEKGTPEKREIW